MAMNLSKAQIEQIARELRDQLSKIGEPEREGLKKAAREKFFRTPDGKKLAHLRVALNEPRMGLDVVSRIEEAAAKSVVKPFNGYIGTSDLEKRVAVLSMDANTGADIMDTILKEWYAKLKPAVRKRFGL